MNGSETEDNPTLDDAKKTIADFVYFETRRKFIKDLIILGVSILLMCLVIKSPTHDLVGLLLSITISFFAVINAILGGRKWTSVRKLRSLSSSR